MLVDLIVAAHLQTRTPLGAASGVSPLAINFATQAFAVEPQLIRQLAFHGITPEQSRARGTGDR